LKERHWQDMSELTGYDFTPNAGTSLSKILDLNLGKLLPL